MNTVTRLLPLAIGAALVAGLTWFLLDRDVELGRWLLAALILGHGLAHLAFVVPTPEPAKATGSGMEWPFDLGRSWPVTRIGLDARHRAWSGHRADGRHGRHVAPGGACHDRHPRPGGLVVGPGRRAGGELRCSCSPCASRRSCSTSSPSTWRCSGSPSCPAGVRAAALAQWTHGYPAARDRRRAARRPDVGPPGPRRGTREVAARRADPRPRPGAPRLRRPDAGAGQGDGQRHGMAVRSRPIVAGHQDRPGRAHRARSGHSADGRHDRHVAPRGACDGRQSSFRRIGGRDWSSRRR